VLAFTITIAKLLLGEVLSTSIHVLNLTPCVPLQFDVPDKVWTGKDVSYDQFACLWM